MFICSIPVVIVVAVLSTALPALFTEKNPLWYLVALVLSPGWLLSALITPSLPPQSFLDLRGLFIAFLANSVYWFTWIFWFVLRSDRRWRQKRAARIDA
jgi:hypothetical protein